MAGCNGACNIIIIMSYYVGSFDSLWGVENWVFFLSETISEAEKDRYLCKDIAQIWPGIGGRERIAEFFNPNPRPFTSSAYRFPLKGRELFRLGRAVSLQVPSCQTVRPEKRGHPGNQGCFNQSSKDQTMASV